MWVCFHGNRLLCMVLANVFVHLIDRQRFSVLRQKKVPVASQGKPDNMTDNNNAHFASNIAK